MSQQPPPPNWQQGGDPKASAKAAKAYAKASRPWYKKKRFIIPIALVVLIVIISATSSGGGSDDGPEKVAGNDTSSGSKDGGTTSDDGGKAKAGSKSSPIKVGETVKLTGTQYTVKAVRRAPTAGTNEFTQEKADGAFVIVTLTIENKKSETKTFSDSAAKFVTKDGRSYSTDQDGTFAVMGDGEEPLFLTDMQPDLPKTGQLVFDVPPAKIKGGLLEVSDLFGGGKAYIALGLK